MVQYFLIPYLVFITVISCIFSALFVGAWRNLGRQIHALLFAAGCGFGALAWLLNLMAGTVFPLVNGIWAFVGMPTLLMVMAVLSGYRYRSGRRLYLRYLAIALLALTAAQWLAHVTFANDGIALAIIPASAGVMLLWAACSVKRPGTDVSTAERVMIVIFIIFGLFELAVMVISVLQVNAAPESRQVYQMTLFGGLPPLYVGAVIATLFVLMSDQMVAMEALRQSLDDKRAEAERLASTKSMLLQNMSHEIRNPLGSMTLLANMLARAGGLPPEEKAWANRISLGSERVTHLLNDVLDFSKLEEGKVVLVSQATDLKALLAGCIDLVSLAAEQKGLKLSLIVAPDMPAQIWVDGPRLRQIIDNLLANAVRFTSTGSVTIHAGPHREPGLLEIKIADTGVGIPADKQPHLFARFHQVDGALAELGGSGLGLAICRGLIDLMDGDIGLVSEVSIGTTVWLTLPLRAADDVPHATDLQDLQA